MSKHAGLRAVCFRSMKIGFQSIHLLLALLLAVMAVLGFAAAPSMFDLLESYGNPGAHAINGGPSFLRNVSGASMDMRRLTDIPILSLLLTYSAIVVWQRGSGVLVWQLTLTVVPVVALLLTVDLGATKLLEWRYFSSRTTSIIINVVLLAFGWTMIILPILGLRKQYPFKFKETPIEGYVQQVAQWIWNCLALLFILTLCLLVWFSRLYTSWACVRNSTELLTLCQFTDQVQCWKCNEFQTSACDDISICIESDLHPFHCLSPINTLTVEEISGSLPLFMYSFLVEGVPENEVKVASALCVINYNIGIFTFITVFAYVGGLYVFLRMVLNALMKFIFALSMWLAKNLITLFMNHCSKARQRQKRLAALMASTEHDSSDSD